MDTNNDTETEEDAVGILITDIESMEEVIFPSCLLISHAPLFDDDWINKCGERHIVNTFIENHLSDFLIFSDVLGLVRRFLRFSEAAEEGLSIVGWLLLGLITLVNDEHADGNEGIDAVTGEDVASLHLLEEANEDAADQLENQDGNPPLVGDHGELAINLFVWHKQANSEDAE